MPLHKIIHFNASTRIFIWKIAESYEELLQSVTLKPLSLLRLENMKSEGHKKGFLSIRRLLQESGHSDRDLFYDEFGKPHLENESHISITHSFGFSALIISDQKSGIDIEMQRDKIALIANKFIDSECDFTQENTSDYIRKLTVIWGAKEAIFKIQNEKGISFKDHISVFPFEMDNNTTTALLTFANLNKVFSVFFEEIEGFTLVYAFENN